MKKLILIISAIIFTFFRVFPLQKNKIVLLRRFPQWGSIGVLGNALAADPRGFRVLRIERWRRLSTLFHLATAGTIFVNDGFTPLAYFPLSKRARVVQIWHADGALKRWGASVAQPFPEAKRWTHILCASETIRPFWAEAFGVSPERVLPLGSPYADALMQATRPKKASQVVLYAPSFRDDDPHSEQLLSQFYFAKFKNRLNNAALLVRLHPKIHGKYTLPDWVVDVTNEPDLSEILRRCDCVITDYSSLMLDAAALDIPVFLYTFDYDGYMSCDRGFYVDLREMPPGPITQNFDELLNLLTQPDQNYQLRKTFSAFHLGEIDGHSNKRIIEAFFPLTH
jgi:CDP-ribitol ribitolphosphotransferase